MASIGRIEDVAIHGEWIVFGAPLSIYPIGSPIDGRVAMFRNNGAGVAVMTTSAPLPPVSSLTRSLSGSLL